MSRHMVVQLPVLFFEEGKKVVAYTPALDISTSGKNLEQARKRFDELVDIFFDELEEMGTLEEVLLECGWKRLSRPERMWQPPRVVGSLSETVKVPCPA